MAAPVTPTAKPDLSRRRALLALAAVTGLSVAVRVTLGTLIPAPFVFLDELGYEQMARSFAHSGHFILYGKAGLAYSPLYPVLLSPIYAVTSSASTAYEAVKVVNAVLISLSIVAVYAIARFFLARRLAVTVAGLAAIAPLMAYSSVELSENLAYPLCLAAIWAMLRATREPRARNDLVLLGTIFVATSARLQLVVLVPAALTAILLVSVLDRRSSARWTRRITNAVTGHALLFGVVATAAVAVAVRTATNGGSLPLAGRYSIVGNARPPIGRVFEIIFHHVAELDLAVAVIPFACTLLAAYALARRGFPRDALIFGAVALAVTAWLLVEVGIDAAAFDTGRVRAASGQAFGDLPRIHERYLIYVIPFFLVALVAAVHLVRQRVPGVVHIAIALCVALVPAAIPYVQDINESLIADSPALQLFADVKAGRVTAVDHPVLAVLVVSSLLAVVYLLAFMGRHRPLAMVVMVPALLVMSAAYASRVASAGKGSLALNLSSHGAWVDRAHAGDAVLVSGKGVRRVALLETAFFNFSISRLAYVCWSGFETDFGEQQLHVGSDGRLRGPAGALRVRYAVVPKRFGVPGKILASDTRGKLELVAPANGFLTVPKQNRARLGCGA